MSQYLWPQTPLPPEARARYVSYKKDTAIISEWLADRGQACGCHFMDPSQPSVREMGEAALKILQSSSSIPPELYWPFKDAIRNRIYLQVYYKGSGQDASNASHDFFLNGLIRIFRSLFPPTATTGASISAKIEEDKLIEPNPYALLETLIDDAESATPNELDMHTDIIEDDDDSTQEEINYGPRQTFEDLILVIRLRMYRVIDEDVGTIGPNGIDDFRAVKEWAADFMRHMMEYDEVFNLIDSYWEKCRDGSMGLITATLLTNSAFRMMNQFRASRTKLKLKGHEDFLGRVRGLLHALSLEFIQSLDRKDAKRDVFFNGSGFVLPWYQLLETKDDPSNLSGPVEIVKLADHVPPFQGSEAKLAFESFPEWQKLCSSNQQYMNKVLKSITQLMEGADWKESVPYYAWSRETQNRDDSWFHPYRLPLCGDVHDYFKDSAVGILTSSVFGLQVLLGSSRTFLWHPSGSVNKGNPRIIALRLAGLMKRSVDRMLALPTLYPGSSGLHYPQLHEFSNSLQQFLAEKRFDVYYQTPWVAGAQMLQLWRPAFYYGIHMWNDGAYVPAVLHLFNMLVQKKQLNEADYPVLSGLCEGVEPVWGWAKVGRPTQNFRSSFAVVVCGNIPKDGAGKKQHRRRQKVQVPITYPSAFDDDVRILPIKWFTWSFDREGYNLTHDFHCRLLGISSTSINAEQCTQTYYSRLCGVDIQPPESSHQMLLRTCTHSQRPLVEAYEKDFYGGVMPAARTDWFSVYSSCTEALVKFKAALDPDIGITFDEGVFDESIGVDLAVMLFDHVDEHDELGRRFDSSSKRREEGLFEAACAAIDAAFKDKKVEDYLWEM